MNWPTYKGMSKEQREEYDYRFGYHPNISWKFICLSLIAIAYMMTNTIFLVYLIFTNDTFIELQEPIMITVENLSTIFNSVFTIIGAVFIADVFGIVYYIIGRRRWLKKNNINKVKDKNLFLSQMEEWLK